MVCSLRKAQFGPFHPPRHYGHHLFSISCAVLLMHFFPFLYSSLSRSFSGSVCRHGLFPASRGATLSRLTALPVTEPRCSCASVSPQRKETTSKAGQRWMQGGGQRGAKCGGQIRSSHTHARTHTHPAFLCRFPLKVYKSTAAGNVLHENKSFN